MNRYNNKKLGIIGGMGPYAGVDLFTKILDASDAKSDYDHIPSILFSVPEEIEDRNDYINGKSTVNPAYSIANVIMKLSDIGISHCVIACNSAHSPIIMEKVHEELARRQCNIRIINMIEQISLHIFDKFPKINKVGVLSVSGTYYSKVYNLWLNKHGVDVIELDVQIVNKMHSIIWDPYFGIKAKSHPVADRAFKETCQIVEYMKDKGAQLVILGCTEFPLLLAKGKLGDLPVLDANEAFALRIVDIMNKEV